jgi:hypothetical protein
MYQRAAVFSVHNLSRSHLKIRIFGRDQGYAEDQSAGILKYVEDLRRGLNFHIGRKDFFETASGNIFPFCLELYYNTLGFSSGTPFALPHMNKMALPETKM